MRVAIAFIVLLAAGCAGDREIGYRITDANPAVPLRAIQVFQVDGDGWWSTPSFAEAEEGEGLVMPHEGDITIEYPTPPLLVCAVAVDVTGELLFSAVSPPIEAVEDLAISVGIQLEPHPDGTVPQPCGAHAAQFPSAGAPGES